jgi:predicted DNA-binding protein with PD1-like motif
MEYTKVGSRYVLRLDKGEEVITTLLDFLKKEDIRLGRVWALGGMENVTLGLLRKSDMQFARRSFNQGMEIASFFGTITEKDNQPYLHAHTVVTDENMQAYGGHLFEGYVFPTMEVMVDVIEGGHVGRALDSDTGIFIMDFGR